MTHEDTTPKTELEVKIAFARQKLAELQEACQDPEVRNAVCDLFWDDDNPEDPLYSVEEYCDESGGEGVVVRCAIALADYSISGGGEDDDGNELPYKYENV